MNFQMKTEYRVMRSSVIWVERRSPLWPLWQKLGSAVTHPWMDGCDFEVHLYPDVETAIRFAKELVRTEEIRAERVSSTEVWRST